MGRQRAGRDCSLEGERQDTSTVPQSSFTQLRACEVAAIAFCRLLERWGRGDAVAVRRQARDRRRSVTRRTGWRRRSPGLERRSPRTWSNSSPTRAEGRSWYGGPGAAELVEWRPVLERAGVSACPNRTAAVYLELAVLVRALQGLEGRRAPRRVRPTASSLWAGLFDLQQPRPRSRRSTTRGLWPRKARGRCLPRVVVVGSVQPRPRRASRAAAATGRDGRRWDVRPGARRERSEPGGRLPPDSARR